MKRNLITLQSASVLVTLILVLGLAGCQTTTDEVQEEVPAADTGSEFDDAAATQMPEPTPVAEPVRISIEPVYFDFDRAEIRPDAVANLRGAGDQLTASRQRVVISGHCDERGSEEYNLALGERRAASVRRYLKNLGVREEQMTIVSYGEIRPAAEGHNERAWALNRRAEFELAN